MKRATGKWAVTLACVLATLTISSQPVYAQVASGTITQIIVQSGGVVFVSLSSVGTGRASCAPGGRWAFSVNAADGQAMLATLLSRQAAQRTVQVNGKGTCSVWPDSEDVYLVVTQ